ncbi:MAG: acetate--CoA ligase [Patescibacteria group bacterium]
MSEERTKDLTEVLLSEQKLYQPSADIVDQANVKDYDAIVKKATDDYEGFWATAAGELEWYKPWKKVLNDTKKPFYKWFDGGKCNIFHNALERHQQTAVKDKVAYYWENGKGEKRSMTYKELYEKTNRFAGVLKKLGVKKGEVVSIYMPIIPETAIAMLACAKIGAMHSVVYAGFSYNALRDRINDAKAKICITADGGVRRGKDIKLKETVDKAVSEECPSIEKVIVVKNSGVEFDFNKDRDIWFDETLKWDVAIPKTEKMKATDPLFVLYTSGTTSKPKGVIHAHGGYMVGIYYTLKLVFDIKDNDVFWCTADPGWITGHSYIVYGPLINGVTSVMYDGAPDFPEPDRLWKLVDDYKVTIFYTAPTLIRLLMKYGDEWPAKHDLSSIRLLGSVGEPINPEAWRWFHKHIGKDKTPIMDTWWQTETGMFMICPLPVLALKAGSVSKPFPGIQADVVDEKGNPAPVGKGGYLVIKNPWPAMLCTLFNNPKRYLDTYWNKIPGVYTTGDLAAKDKDGYIWIQGRSDDVLKISGHRIGNAEIEHAIVEHGSAVEAGVIGIPDEIKGEVAKAFVILKKGVEPNDELTDQLKKKVRELLGPLAVMKEIEYVDKLPKTRSGKIMRRVLKAKELGQPLGDTSTLQE